MVSKRGAMRLGVAALCALLAVVAAQPDVEDLPPVDELVGQVTNGELTPKDLVDMTPRMPEDYLRDVKIALPVDLKEKVAELIHQRMADDQRAREGEDNTDNYDDYNKEDEANSEEEPVDNDDDDEQEEEYYYEENDAHSEEEPVTDDDEDGEQERQPELAPPEKLEEEDSGMLRAGPVLQADTVENGGTGTGGSGSSGVSEGGVLPGESIDDRSAIRQLLVYFSEEKEACQARYNDAFEFYTRDNTLGLNKVSSEVAYLKQWRQFAEDSAKFDLTDLDSPELYSLFVLLKKAGVAGLDDTQLNEFVNAITNLETKFSNVKVCDFYDNSKCDLKLYKDVRVKMASSTNRDELKHYWLSWRNGVGRKSAEQYAKYIELLGTAAKITDADWNAWSLMTYPYRHGKTIDILSLLEQLWEKISPLYDQLHSYARIRLQQRYGADAVPSEGPIPAHLLGSHEADDWSALEQLMKPYDNASSLDFHGQCNEKTVDVGQLKRAASEMYSDLGLNKTSTTELLLSRLNVAAADADSVQFLPRVLDGCHNDERSAVGIYPTNTTLSDYIELIEIFGTMQQYKERAKSLAADSVGFPNKNRIGFNAYGLDLAIGGARALAAITPVGLQQKLGFQIFDNSEHAASNFQMAVALKLLPRLAASMAAVRWESDVMNGLISENQYNDKWWEYKREYQGVSPPEDRNDDQFDAFADGTLTLPNYHLRRLIGGIAMFSVHQYHCKLYGDASTPTSECAIFNNKALGESIRGVLVSGNSKPLKDQLQTLTGQKDLSAAVLVEEMQPLMDWLVRYNEEHGGGESGGVGESSQLIAIIVGVVIAVIVLGLIIFFVVARKKQKPKDDAAARGDYRGVATREGRGDQHV